MSEIDWSKAPEGATHYDPGSADGEYPSFMKISCGNWYYWSRVHDEWIGHSTDRESEYIPRPTKQEWEGGLFPVPIGAKCECTFGVEHHDTWHKGECVFQGIDPEGREYVVIDTGTYQACFRSLDHIRPLKSQHERQREELLSFLEGNWLQLDKEEIVDAILSRYNLEPKP